MSRTMSSAAPLNSLRALVARPSTPRLLIPAAALALILALPLSADPVLWMAFCGVGAALTACDAQRGAGRRAGYLAAAALVGLVVSPDGFSRIAPGLIALGAALPLLAFGLAYLGRGNAQAAPVSAPAALLMRGDDDALMTQLYVTTDGMVKAAQAIKEVAAQQSGGALEQVDVLHLTNHKVEDFMTLAAQVSDETNAMTRTAHDAADIARGGQRALDQLLDGMGQISGQVATIGATIVQLAQLARRIDEIINSVGEIATQSNLLALNASIEAARAGTGGRGFAVVADEVRALARQSTTAAGQIRAILGEIQAAVRQTVTATEVGVALANDGMEAARAAHQVMSRLAANVIQSYEAIRAISGAIREQADRMDEISISLARIEQITQQNLVSTRVVDRISGNLTQLSDELGSARPAAPELA